MIQSGTNAMMSHDFYRPDPMLSIYLDQASAFGLLTPTQEKEQAREIVALRHQSWDAAMAADADRDAVIAIIQTELDDEAPAQIKRLWRAGEQAPKRLVDALVRIDHDGHVVDTIDAAFRDQQTPFALRLRALRSRYRRARNRFMCSNLRLVVSVARKYGRNHMPLSDRVQEGNIGLITAIDRFDPERGYRFSTYAAWWIRHAVTRALTSHSRTVRVPAHIHQLFTKARRARIAMRAEIGREPTIAELAARIDSTVEKIRNAFAVMDCRTLSLEEISYDGGEATLGDALVDETIEDWDARIGDLADAVLMTEVVDDLDAWCRDIMLRRFGLHGIEVETLHAIAVDHGVSRERIRQKQVETLELLRDRIERARRRPRSAHAGKRSVPRATR